MPELPEVETVCRGLAPHLVGRRFQRVAAHRPDLRFPLPERFAARLEGRTVDGLARRAKYLVLTLSGGEVLAMHLGMTGRFTVTPRGSNARLEFGEYAQDAGDPAKHEHVTFTMDDGTRVAYSDPRRFGYMRLIAAADLDADPMFRGLGPEPLDGGGLTAEALARRARGRRTDLKAFLMDQRTVAGLGNIYVCEALFAAGLSPLRSAASLARRDGRPTERARRLVEAIPRVLETAIAAGGSTLRDYRRADGSAGGFQERFSVYGRAGEPCIRKGCRGMVRRTIQGARSTFHCPTCQR